MSDRAAITRQWVPMAGGSCDIRMGMGVLEEASKVLKSQTGGSSRCLVVLRDDVEDDLAERLRRQLVDGGYQVFWHRVAADAPVRTLAEAERLAQALGANALTADDLCCVLGDADLVSLASFVCGGWCGGMSAVAVPTNELALLEGALIPRGLDVAGSPQVLGVRPSVRRVLYDTDLALSPLDSETSRHARVLMASAAMGGSEREFSNLWDRVDELMQDDPAALTTQLLATAKARGQASGSTAAAVRNSLEYGVLFAHALGGLVEKPLPTSLLLAEALRFSARLSVALEKLPLDDMFAQDELLDALGLGTASCDVDPTELVAALKRERFARSNRFMLPLPLAIGRVRLTAVPDDLLAEHAAAWCAAHRS